MKVAMVTHSLSRLGGGLPSVLQPLTQTLSDSESVDVSVHGLHDDFSKSDRSLWGSVPTHAHPSKWPNSLGRSPSLTNALLDENADILHTHGIFKHTSASVRKVSSAKNIPYLVSPHGMLDPWAVQNSRLKKQIALWWFESKHLQNAKCFHALCSSEAQSISELGYTQPIFVVPNAIDLPSPPVAPVFRQKEILFLGRIHPKKGLLPLLHAWNSIHKSAKGWILKIGGWNDGDHATEIRDFVERENLTDSVQFLGPLFGEEKEQAFQTASAFVLPSFSEGLPMTVLEAWAYSLPVLITDHCNLPEGFKASAAVRISPNPDSIGEGLHRITSMSESERQSMGTAGRELVQERFTWPKVAQQYVEIYNWILGGDMPETLWHG